MKTDAAYAALENQVAFLQAQLDKVTDALIRIQRTQVGLPEAVKKPTPPPEPAPECVIRYLNGFESATVRQMEQADITSARQRGTPWDQIIAEKNIPFENGS